MLLVTSLYRDFLVSSWGAFTPSFWDWCLFAGMIGVFLVPFLLFVRFLPVISAFEVKEAAFEDGRSGMREPTPARGVFGLLAEFAAPSGWRGRQDGARAGFRSIDAYLAVPGRGLAEALGFRDSRVPLADAGRRAFSAAALGYGMQVYANLDYPDRHRRAAAVASPAFMLDHLRADGVCSRCCSRSAACWRSTVCRGSIIRCSTITRFHLASARPVLPGGLRRRPAFERARTRASWKARPCASSGRRIGGAGMKRLLARPARRRSPPARDEPSAALRHLRAERAVPRRQRRCRRRRTGTVARDDAGARRGARSSGRR